MGPFPKIPFYVYANSLPKSELKKMEIHSMWLPSLSDLGYSSHAERALHGAGLLDNLGTDSNGLLIDWWAEQ